MCHPYNIVMCVSHYTDQPANHTKHIQSHYQLLLHKVLQSPFSNLQLLLDRSTVFYSTLNSHRSGKQRVNLKIFLFSAFSIQKLKETTHDCFEYTGVCVGIRPHQRKIVHYWQM